MRFAIVAAAFVGVTGALISECSDREARPKRVRDSSSEPQAARVPEIAIRERVVVPRRDAREQLSAPTPPASNEPVAVASERPVENLNAETPVHVASAAPIAPASAAPIVPASAAPIEVSNPEPEVRRRRLPSPDLKAWSLPGLCAENLAESETVRRSLRKRFRVWERADVGRFLIDPRLSDTAAPPIALQLLRSRLGLTQELGLEMTLPEVFVYADAELLRASACVNGDVVAFYDGALHVVAGDRDLAASVTHELAHHALMSVGLQGPAWAQEGIAMHAAGERWWRERGRLARLAIEALALESMEESIPYKLPKDQAVTFYVQAAAMVGCVLVRKGWALKDLVEQLRASVDAVEDVPELAQPARLEACISAR